MGIKQAEKAGSWYEKKPEALADEIDGCLADARTRYGVHKPTPGRTPVAAVVPHAGLMYSGAIAALAYAMIREAWKRVDVFVVFGACHRSMLYDPAVWADGAWETPLGPILVDAELAHALVDDGLCRIDERPHLGDNSIELQAPFIRRLFPEAAIVPVAMSSVPGMWRSGEAAFRAAKRLGRRAVAVGSTDLTHYGTSYGVTPAGTGPAAVDWVRQNDAHFLEAVTAMRGEDIVERGRVNSTACGAGAAAAAAGWASAAGCGEGRLLAHTNSYELFPRGEADNMVGYASVVYEG